MFPDGRFRRALALKLNSVNTVSLTLTSTMLFYEILYFNQVQDFSYPENVLSSAVTPLAEDYASSLARLGPRRMGLQGDGKNSQLYSMILGSRYTYHVFMFCYDRDSITGTELLGWYINQSSPPPPFAHGPKIFAVRTLVMSHADLISGIWRSKRWL
ncbi:hypothetical protein AB1N83_010342 [Pleurotus pulmonarius]